MRRATALTATLALADFLIRTEIHSTITGSGFVAVSFARVRFECK
jgi:hypothetical protein